MRIHKYRPDEEWIAFHTTEKLTAADLRRLLVSLEGIYDVLLSRHILDEQTYIRERDVAREMKRIARPPFSQLFETWVDYERQRPTPPRRHSAAPTSLAPQPDILSRFPGEIDVTTINQIYAKLSFHARSTERLHIDRMLSFSPGSFSFNGLGEVILQFREFVKDLWYRNKHEARKADLELFEKHLKIQRAYSNEIMPKILANHSGVIPVLHEHVDELYRLEHEGVLLPPNEHLDERPMLPIKEKAVKTASKRKRKPDRTDA